MRSRLWMLGVVTPLLLAGCGGTPPPDSPPAPTPPPTSSAPTSATPDSETSGPKVEPYACGQVCRVTEITDATKAALEAHGDEDTLVIEFPSTATQEQIATISKLGWVKKLRLKGAGVTDLAPLASLDNLETLDLIHTNVSTLAPLVKLPRLRSVHIASGVMLTDPWPGKPLAGKAETIEKAAQAEQFELTPDADKEDYDRALPPASKTDLDIAALKDLLSLRDLRVSGLKVPDAVWATLKQVTELDLAYMSIGDPKQLAAMPLVELHMNKVFVPNYDFLKTMTGLQQLEIAQNRLTDVGFLASLKGLKRLMLTENPFLTSIAALKGNTALESLDLDDCGVLDLRPLDGSPKLDFIDIQGTPIKSLAPLHKSPMLRTINARRTTVTDLSGLEKLPVLAHLHIPENVPKDKLAALQKAKPDLKVLVY